MRTKNYFHYMLFAASVLFLFLSACEERVNINTEASPPRLVIYGYITTDTAQQTISITRSTGYFVDTPPEGISNATVSISCDSAVFELRESPTQSGLYLTSSDVYGVAGKTYTLRASVDFNGDGNIETYKATSFLPFPAVLDSAAVTPSPIQMEKGRLQVLVWGKLPDESSGNFSFHLFRNGIAMNDSLRGFRIFQDDYIKTKVFAALPIFQLNPEDHPKDKLSPGDTLTVQVESLTSEYATFITDSRTELRGPIPLFGGPPANIKTNIHCVDANSGPDISGFFTAYSKRSTTMIYKVQ